MAGDAGLALHAAADGVRFRVRLTPRAGTDRIDGLRAEADGSLCVAARVRAVPEKGAANAALEILIAKALRIPKSAVQVEKGMTGRAKTILITGAPDETMTVVKTWLQSLASKGTA